MGRIRTVALLAISVLSLSCEGEGMVGLYVDLKTDLIPGVELDRIEVYLDEELAADLPADGDAYLEGERILETEVAVGDVRLEVVLYRGNQAILVRHVRVRVTEATGVTVLMTRDCRDVSCDDAAASQCVGGACAPEDCTVESSSTCPPAECTVDADCGEPSPCARPQCQDGSCFLEGDDSLCASDEVCVPDVGCAARTRGPAPATTATGRISSEGLDDVMAASMHPGGGFLATGRVDGMMTSYSHSEYMPTNGNDGFVARFRDDGTLDWARLVGGGADETNIDDEGRVLTVDAAGNVYLGGSVAGDVLFGGTPTSAAGRSEEAFVASWAADGTFRWVTRFAGSSFASDLALDDSGTVWAVGTFVDSTTIEGRTLTGDDWDVFLVGLDAMTGGVLDAQSFGGAGKEDAHAVDIAPSGEVVVVVSFELSIDFGTGPLAASGGSGVAWITPGGAVGTTIAVTDGTVNDVAIGDDGRAILGGGTTGPSLVIGDSPAVATRAWELFVSSVDAGGSVEWTHVFGGGGSDRVASVAVDASGNTYALGELERAVDIGGGALYSAGGDDIFVASYGPNGAHRWSKIVGGPSADIARSITHDETTGAQCVGGSFEGLEDRDYDGQADEAGGGGTGIILVLR